jgi:hypothetical protein
VKIVERSKKGINSARSGGGEAVECGCIGRLSLRRRSVIMGLDRISSSSLYGTNAAVEELNGVRLLPALRRDIPVG